MFSDNSYCVHGMIFQYTAHVIVLNYSWNYSMCCNLQILANVSAKYTEIVCTLFSLAEAFTPLIIWCSCRQCLRIAGVLSTHCL